MASILSLEALQRTLSVDIQNLVLSAATLGVLSHISLFRTLPVEEYLYSLVCLYAATVLVIVLAYLYTREFSFVHIVFHVGCIASAFNAGLASSITVYRLFFHRLRRFDGPWLSKLSRFYDAYLAGKNVQYHVEIAKMHEKYGDFIRTGRLSMYLRPQHGWSHLGYRTARSMHCSQISSTIAPLPAVQMWEIDILCPGAD